MTLPLSILALHFLGDWLLQSLALGWMALEKSRSWKALLVHTISYSLFFFSFGWAFVLITFVLHTVVDAITSRLTAKLWYMPAKPILAKHIAWQEYVGIITLGGWTHFTYLDVRKRGWFFVMLGLDQLIHFYCLAWTLSLLKP